MEPQAESINGLIKRMSDDEVRVALSSINDRITASPSVDLDFIRNNYWDVLYTKHDILSLGGDYDNLCSNTRNRAFLYVLCLYSDSGMPASFNMAPHS